MNLIKVYSICCIMLFGLGGCGIQDTSCDSNKSKNMVKQYVNREFDKSIANGLQNEVFTEEEEKEIRENMYLHLQHVTILDESEETNTSLCSATLQVRFTDFPSNFKTETDKETERKIQDVLNVLKREYGLSLLKDLDIQYSMQLTSDHQYQVTVNNLPSEYFFEVRRTSIEKYNSMKARVQSTNK